METTAPNAAFRPTAGRRAILSYTGALTRENCTELKQAVLTEIDRQRSEVILDFKHVVLMDSAALEVLMELNESMQAQGKRLKIVRVQKLCKDILIATRILYNLNTYKDLHAAITSTT
jgi:anti-anti-sigma factor